MNHNMMERRVATASGLTVVQDPTNPSERTPLERLRGRVGRPISQSWRLQRMDSEGAFEASLQRDDQRALFCHESA